MKHFLPPAMLCALFVSVAPDAGAEPSQTWSSGSLGFGPGDRVLIKEVVVTGARPTVRAPFVAMLKSALLDAGVSFVATPEEVRRESAQRREERANDEVQQATLPEKATIIRENVEVKVTLDVTHEEKDLQTILAPLTRRHPILGGVGIEKKRASAIVTLQTWDNATQTSRNQLVAVGQEKDYSEVILGVIPVILRQGRSEDEKRELKAVAAALGKLRDMVHERLEVRTTEVKGHVLGVVDWYVILDVGRNNGVRRGALFSVARVVTHGNVRTHLPPSATLRVVTVDGNSCCCEVATGELATIGAGDLVTTIRSAVS